MSDHLPPGLYSSQIVSHNRYHSDPCERPSLSSHIAVELVKRSPGHAARIHPRLGGQYERRTSDAMDTGSILHGILLESGPQIVEVDADSWRTDKAKAQKAMAEDEGKIAVLKGKYAAIRAAAEEVRKTLPFDIAAARKEVTAIWTSGETPCRARIDCLSPDWTIDDLKFTDDATVSSADRNIAGFGYHVQAAANIDAIETLFPEAAGRVRFVLDFIEWERPQLGVIRREIRGQLLDVGRRQWNRAKAIWAQCLAANVWPGYSAEVTEAQCPAWIAAAELDTQIANQKPPF